MSHGLKQGESQQVHWSPGIAFKEFNILISHEISKHPLKTRKNIEVAKGKKKLFEKS